MQRHNWVYQGGNDDPDTGEHLSDVYECSFCLMTANIPADSEPGLLGKGPGCDSPINKSSDGIKLWLDDERRAPFGWVHCNRVEDAKVLLHAGLVAYASLDHDLGFTDEEDPLKNVECETGYDLCKWMAEHSIWPKYKPLVHSANPVGAANMRSVIDRHFQEK